MPPLPESNAFRIQLANDNIAGTGHGRIENEIVLIHQLDPHTTNTKTHTISLGKTEFTLQFDRFDWREMDEWTTDGNLNLK